MFALSPELMLDFDSGVLIKDEAELPQFERELMDLDFRPRGFDAPRWQEHDLADLRMSDSGGGSGRGGGGILHHMGQQNALSNWINCWNERFRGVHIAELVVGMAFCAMSMKREQEKPALLFFGLSDCGKTSLMSFLAEMFGFDGQSEMLAKATESALWD